MIQIISQRPLPLQKFITEFSCFFSKPLFISFAIYISGLLLEIKRTNINSIVSKTPFASYQKIQYFLSDSKWNSDDLNTHRLALLQANPDTEASNRGVLIIDDTSCKKAKDTHKTHGVAFQYSSSDNSVINCNVVVFSAYADSKSRYPIDIAPYFTEKDPLCKSFKLELAEELVKLSISRNILFSHVVFDNWYFSNDFIAFLHSEKRKWISEVEKSRLIHFRGKWVRANELLKLIPSTKFNKTVTLSYSDGSSRTFFLHSFSTFIKGIKSKLLIIVSVKAFKRHWHLSILVYSFLLIAKADSSIADAFDSKNIHTVTDILYKIRTLNNIIAANWISNHPVDFKKYAKLHDSFKISA